MTNNVLTLSNAQARAVFLDQHLLVDAPSGPGKGADLVGVLDHLGFVQVDSINTMASAHDLIMRSRRQQFQPKALRRLVDRDRHAFEGWTHDASILPMAFLPHWQHKFARDRTALMARWSEARRGDFLTQTQIVLDQIAQNGPVSSSDVGTSEKRGTGGWWDWHPSKTALEFLWRTGRIMVTRRVGFRKYYDLTGHVAPPQTIQTDWTTTRDWACRGALQRLGFANHSEIAAFWDLVPVAQAKDWLADHVATGAVTPIEITAFDGTVHPSFALTDHLHSLTEPRSSANRVRILSPFDPALRDRKRALKLFGFDYKIEIFVPAAKRKYGYYVFPVLEGHKIIGRIDVKADRASGILQVQGYWPEAKAPLTRARKGRLQAELSRLLNLSGCDRLGLGPLA
ncbi:MAG: crosslink repair DNA glycosylase YcaQ family protein [Pseudomonadota bacterium]